MRAIAIEEFGGQDKLRIMEIEQPEPADDEVLIMVKAAGVNPVDWKIREGWLKDMIPHEFPLILGWDAAGRVVKVGSKVRKFREGDAVYAYCRKPEVQWGTYAQYVAVAEKAVARKPENMSFEEAGGVPLAALTAYQALVDVAQIKKGQVVLVHAASGGVGTFAVQIARDRGCRVVGTASKRHADYVDSLGLQDHIDYTEVDFREAVKNTYPDGVDVVLDAVGEETLKHSIDVLKDGGKLISIVDPDQIESFKNEGVDAHFVFVEPRGDELAELTHMAEKGRLCAHTSLVLPLESAAKAHAQIESHHTEGKIVLAIV